MKPNLFSLDKIHPTKFGKEFFFVMLELRLLCHDLDMPFIIHHNTMCLWIGISYCCYGDFFKCLNSRFSNICVITMNLENIIHSLVHLYPHQIAESIDHLGTWTGHSINRHKVFFCCCYYCSKRFVFFLIH